MTPLVIALIALTVAVNVAIWFLLRRERKRIDLLIETEYERLMGRIKRTEDDIGGLLFPDYARLARVIKYQIVKQHRENVRALKRLP